ncbi:MAG: SCO family protein [Parachlamydiales bacterium]
MKKFTALLFAIVLAGPSIFAKDLPGASLYHLKAEWLDAEGAKVKLESLKGQVWVLSMVYTTCRFSCPLILDEIKKIKSKVSAKSVKYVLVSMDPETDTPAVLKEFRAEKNLGPEWVVLTAKDEEPMRELSMVLGASIKKVGKDFAHSNLVVVIDPEGVIKFSKDRLNQQIDETAQTIDKLAAVK